MTPGGFERTRRFEGFLPHVYRDSLGVLTIGIGTNLEAGISIRQAQALAEIKMEDNLIEIHQHFPWFDSLDCVRKDVIEDMVYQMGVAGVAKFAAMIEAIQEKNFYLAAEEMLDSLWARQTPTRAHALSKVMAEGKP